MKNALVSLRRKEGSEDGINMVDLMMWVVIAALLLAAAIQGIGYYQQNAYVYQMKSVVDEATSRVTALASDSGAITIDEVDSVVADLNATYGPNIVLTASAIDVTAAGAPDASPYGFELASAVTATTVGPGQTYYIRASHTAVSGYDVIHTFGDTASKKVGTYMVQKGTTNTAGPVVATPTATATPTPVVNMIPKGTSTPLAGSNTATGVTTPQADAKGHYDTGYRQIDANFNTIWGAQKNNQLRVDFYYSGTNWRNGKNSQISAHLFCRAPGSTTITEQWVNFGSTYGDGAIYSRTSAGNVMCPTWTDEIVGAIIGSYSAPGVQAWTTQSTGPENVLWYGTVDQSYLTY